LQLLPTTVTAALSLWLFSWVPAWRARFAAHPRAARFARNEHDPYRSSAVRRKPTLRRKGMHAYFSAASVTTVFVEELVALAIFLSDHAQQFGCRTIKPHHD
jgi:hypothetical protein